MDGFTYNGIHSESFGVYLAPDATDRWEGEAEFEVNSTEVQGRHGGYYYSSRAKIRSITQDCYFEDITLQQREEAKRWLGRRTHGNLILDSRPFEYYRVWPSKVLAGRSWTHVSLTGETVYSGTFTVSFDAFEPFGFLKYKYYDTTDTDGASAYCGILPQSMMPAAPTTSSRQFQVYNCGTEDADTIITLAGSAPNGMTITNLTNGNVCTIPSLPESGTLTLDSRQGLVSDINGPAFEYHNDGFIRLAPYYPDIQNLKVSYSSSSTTLTVVDTTADKSWIGKFVRIGNEWIKISNVSNQGVVTLAKRPATSGTTVITRLAVLNDITITGDGLTLSTFTFDYTPVLSV